MRDWQEARIIFFPVVHGFGERIFDSIAEVMLLRVLSGENREFDVRHEREQLREPKLRAFLSRAQIAAAFVSSGIAVAHGNDRDARLVVEGLAIYIHPFAQTVAAGVVPGDARRVYFRSRRLAYDQNACSSGRAQHRARAQWQFAFAQAAGAYFVQERIQACGR